MPFEIKCTACGEMVAVADEHRGWTVRCPVCQAQFQAVEALPQVPPAHVPQRARVPANDFDNLGTDDDDDDDYDDEDYLPIAPLASEVRARAKRRRALRAVAGPSRFLEGVAWFHLAVIEFMFACVIIAALDAKQ